MAWSHEQDWISTVELPANSFIWPLKPKDEVKPSHRIVGEFVESKVILSVHQGNHIVRTYWVNYRLVNKKDIELLPSISFIVRRAWPTPDSGIKLKALPFPFKKGKMEFLLKQNKNVRYKKYFEVLGYYPI